MSTTKQSEPRTIELSIGELAAGGDGVGRDADGRVTFVPATVPGDRVRVQLIDERKSFARGVVADVLTASTDRVDPRCRFFVDRSCGGCQWQHVAVAAQRRAKQHLVQSALRKLSVTVAAIDCPVPDYQWRRRARLHWARPRRADRAVLGFFAPRSDRVTDIDDCAQLEPALQAAIGVLRAELCSALTGRGEIDVVAGRGGDVCVYVRGPCDPAAVETLVGRAPIVGVALGKRRFGATDVELEGGLQVAAAEFAQASAAGNEHLCQLVATACGDVAGKDVLELFAGGGNFTRLLTGAAALLAVDSHALPTLSSPHRSRRGDAADITARLVQKRRRFDLVVLDPPRTGARATMPHIAKLAPARIVYVSCNPATLARDAEILAGHGYTVTSAQPIDLMPQTAHVEVVAVLDKT